MRIEFHLSTDTNAFEGIYIDIYGVIAIRRSILESHQKMIFKAKKEVPRDTNQQDLTIKFFFS